MFNVIALSLASIHHGDLEINKIIHKLIPRGVVGHFENFLLNLASALRTPRANPMRDPLRHGMLRPQQLFSTHAPFLPHIYFLTTAIYIDTFAYLPSCGIQILSLDPAVHDEAALSDPIQPNTQRRILLCPFHLYPLLPIGASRF